MARRLVVDHDGSQDDILTLLMALLMPEKRVIGTLAVPADSLLEDAVHSSRQVLALCGRKDVPVVCGSEERCVNPFPLSWRQCASATREIEPLKSQDVSGVPVVTGEEASPEQWIRQQLRAAAAAGELVDFVVTGPISNLVAAVDAAELLKCEAEGLADMAAAESESAWLRAAVGRVAWMGGAIVAAGNVWTKNTPDVDHDESAEWNAFWDPVANARLFELGLDLWLDATDHVSLSQEFLQRLVVRQPPAPLAKLAHDVWQSTGIFMPDYHLWDTLTAALYHRPELATWQEMEVAGVHSGPSQGRTVALAPALGAPPPPAAQMGRPGKVHVAMDIAKEDFYQYLVALFEGGLQSSSS